MTITEEGVITPQTTAEIVAYGWEVYRRSQQIPWTGALFIAQSRLFREVAPFACNRLYAPRWGSPHRNGIRGATAALILAVLMHCGDADAAFVSGQDGRVAA